MTSPLLIAALADAALKRVTKIKELQARAKDVKTKHSAACASNDALKGAVLGVLTVEKENAEADAKLIDKGSPIQARTNKHLLYLERIQTKWEDEGFVGKLCSGNVLEGIDLKSIPIYNSSAEPKVSGGFWGKADVGVLAGSLIFAQHALDSYPATFPIPGVDFSNDTGVPKSSFIQSFKFMKPKATADGGESKVDDEPVPASFSSVLKAEHDNVFVTLGNGYAFGGNRGDHVLGHDLAKPQDCSSWIEYLTGCRQSLSTLDLLCMKRYHEGTLDDEFKETWVSEGASEEGGLSERLSKFTFREPSDIQVGDIFGRRGHVGVVVAIDGDSVTIIAPNRDIEGSEMEGMVTQVMKLGEVGREYFAFTPKDTTSLLHQSAISAFMASEHGYTEIFGEMIDVINTSIDSSKMIGRDDMFGPYSVSGGGGGAECLGVPGDIPPAE